MIKMIDKKEFLKDLKRIKRKCLVDSNYDPENDIAILVAKHNLSWKIIWKKIQDLLSI